MRALWLTNAELFQGSSKLGVSEWAVVVEAAEVLCPAFFLSFPFFLTSSSSSSSSSLCPPGPKGMREVLDHIFWSPHRLHCRAGAGAESQSHG